MINSKTDPVLHKLEVLYNSAGQETVSNISVPGIEPGNRGFIIKYSGTVSKPEYHIAFVKQQQPLPILCFQGEFTIIGKGITENFPNAI